MLFGKKRNEPSPMGELQQLLSLLRAPRATSGGFVMEFIAADEEDGTSTLAREYALMLAGEIDLSVVLLDLNWPENPQFRFFAEHNTLRTWDMRPDHSLMGSGRESQITFHQVGDSNLVVSEGRSVLAQHAYYPGSGSDFWNALRRSADLVVIDAPAMLRSLRGIMVAPEADAVVLVVSAERTRMSEAVALRNRILMQGGNATGVIFNRYRLPRMLQGVA